MIIAECGQNHMGDMGLAKELISTAKECGADLAKFQLYDSVKLYGVKQKQELTFEQAKELFDYGEKIGIEVFFSVFDVERVDWCEKIGVKRYKVACSCCDRADIAAKIFCTHKPVIVSGLLSWPNSNGLFCVPKYPADLIDYCAMGFENFTLWCGISDHTVGIDCSIIALSRGAEIIEKHFMLEDNPESPDTCVSITPRELKELVRFSKVVKCCI